MNRWVFEEILKTVFELREDIRTSLSIFESMPQKQEAVQQPPQRALVHPSPLDIGRSVQPRIDMASSPPAPTRFGSECRRCPPRHLPR
jgi:hypothetical protein